MQQYFQYLNDYYDKTYVLSVEAAILRREKFEQRFAGLNYSFFFGADKNKFNVEEIIEKGIYDEDLAVEHHRYNKKMQPGEIACSWSHKMIYEDMIRKRYKRILILEDDAVPDPDAVKNIPAILRELPRYWELLWWGWYKNGKADLGAKMKELLYHIQHSMGTLKWDHTIINHLHARKFSNYLKKAGFHDYTYAYAVNRSGAEKLLSMQTPVQFIADNLLSHAGCKKVINSFIAWPAVFLHDSLPDGTHRDSYIR